MIEQYGVSRDTIRAFLSPGEGAGYGLGPDALSGYTAERGAAMLGIRSTSATKPVHKCFPTETAAWARLITKNSSRNPSPAVTR